jgi:hypothetical protein
LIDLGAADAENLQIDTARIDDLPLVLLARRRHFRARDRAARDVNLALGDIEMIEQMFAHEAVVTLRMLRRNREIFVEIVGGARPISGPA